MTDTSEVDVPSPRPGTSDDREAAPPAQALARAITLAAAMGLLALIAFNAGPSSTPNVWRYSYLKLSVLTAIAAAVLYLVLSLRSARLQRFHYFAAYAIATNIVILEVVFRLFPGLVPADLVALLPIEARKEIAAERGMFTDRSIGGDGMLHSFRPGAPALLPFPWVELDREGFRNPSVPTQPVDVVIFGDSVAFARHARKDIGALLRERGMPAYNLAMGGYGPFHYRDAYRRYVTGRGLAHRYVVVFLSPGGTDFADATKYKNVVGVGGDYRDYLGWLTAIGPSWPDRQPSWTLAVAARLPATLRHRLTDVARVLNRAFAEDVTVTLPYATYEATLQIFDLIDLDENDEDWRNFLEAMKELTQAASAAGARTLLVVMPNTGLLYRDHTANQEHFKTLLDERYLRMMGLLERHFAADGVRVVSAVALLAEEVGRTPIAANPLDFHLNTAGWTVVHDRLLAELEP